MDLRLTVSGTGESRFVSEVPPSPNYYDNMYGVERGKVSGSTSEGLASATRSVLR